MTMAATESASARDSREDQHERRREVLVAAAAAEIAEKGLNGVRLRDVATRCHVTTGMLQYYFDTRDELLASALEYSATRHVRHWQDTLESAQSPAQGIRTLLSEMAGEFADSTDNAVWIELCALASRDERFRPLVSRVFDEWQSTIERAITAAVQSGTLRATIPVEDATRILIAAIDGFELRSAASTSATNASRDQLHMHQLADLLLTET